MKKTIKFLAIVMALVSNSKNNAQCFANAGPDQFFCCGGTTTLSATYNYTAAACSCTNITFAWTPTMGLSNPNIANPTAVISNSTYVVCITAHTGTNCATVCCVACDTITIHANGLCCRTTGINESAPVESGINVFPNPVKNNLTLDVSKPLKKGELNFYDINGKIIWKKENITGISKFEINVSTFPRGIYFVKAIDKGKEIYTNKIILE